MKKHKSHLRYTFPAEYNALKNAIHRCHNEKSGSFPDYGARGIAVADQWRTVHGFALFIDHLGPRPGRGYSLDRIDNNKGYMPGNVRWTDRKTQQNNRRAVSQPVKDYGWGIGLTKPTKTGRGYGPRLSPLIPYQGRVQTLIEWARELGVQPATIRFRLSRGLSPEEALNPSTSRLGEKRKIAPNSLLLPTIH